MELATGLVLALIGLPVLGGLLAYLTRGAGLKAIVLLTSLSVAALSLVLLGNLLIDDIVTFNIGPDELEGLEVVIPVLDALLGAFFIYVAYRRRSWVLLGSALITLVVPIYLVSQAEASTGPVLVLDRLALTLVLIISLIGSIICIYALKYMDKDKARPRFFLFMLLFLGAMTGAVLSNELLWLFFFWEVTTLCSFILIGHEGTEEANRSADRALLYTLGGGAAFCIAMLLVYWESGTLDISTLLEGEAFSTLFLVGLGLLMIAAMTKSAQVPFQRWLVGAMVAPTPVSALLHSATMVNLGVYILLRFSPLVATVPSMGLVLTLVGGFSFLVTSVLALRHSNAKRVLAYSTVANLALIVVCVGIGTPLAIAAGMLILIYHAVSKALLFLTVGVVKHETGSEDIENMTDLRQRMPMLAISLYAGAFLMVLPAFGLFAGKWMLSEASLQSLPFLFLFAIAIAVPMAYYAKWLGRAMASGPMEKGVPLRWDEPSPWFTLPLLVLMVAAFALALGLPYVVDTLVTPYLNTFSTSPVQGDLLALTTPFGTLPVAPLFLIVLIPLLVFFLTIRPTKGEISQAYTCGEGGSFKVMGSYLFSEPKEKALLVISDVIGIALLSSIIAMAIFEGVLA